MVLWFADNEGRLHLEGGEHAHYGTKVSADESVRVSSHYRVLFSFETAQVSWRLNTHSTRKIIATTAEPFALTISANLPTVTVVMEARIKVII